MEELCREGLEGSYSGALPTLSLAAPAVLFTGQARSEARGLVNQVCRSASGVEQVGGETGVDLKGANKIHSTG